MSVFDVLILGSGLAGQSLALRLADTHKVALVTKRHLEDSASAWAQGGIAAVLDPADSVESHLSDTFIAGAGLCNPVSSRFVVENGARAIRWLIERGVPFTPDAQSPIGYHLTREGGHGQRRVIHVADATGAAVQATLTEQVRAHPNIAIFEQHITVDLIVGPKIGRPDAGCLGAYVLDIQQDEVRTFAAVGSPEENHSANSKMNSSNSMPLRKKGKRDGSEMTQGWSGIGRIQCAFLS